MNKISVLYTCALTGLSPLNIKLMKNSKNYKYFILGVDVKKKKIKKII